jgi:hypothetical protein
MDIIEQRLVVKDWPLAKPGDELFFGYVVAVGVFPREWNDEGLFAYVDFAYNDSYTRYRLPKDQALKVQLLHQLLDNIASHDAGNGIYGKVWVTLTSAGYKVCLP